METLFLADMPLPHQHFKHSSKQRIRIQYRKSNFNRISISLAVSYFPSCLSRSIIGAERFHYRVRNGIVCVTFAITAKPIETLLHLSKRIHLISDFSKNQANQVISTGKLHTLLYFHIQPINVVVYHDLNGDN